MKIHSSRPRSKDDYAVCNLAVSGLDAAAGLRGARAAVQPAGLRKGDAAEGRQAAADNGPAQRFSNREERGSTSPAFDYCQHRQGEAQLEGPPANVYAEPDQ